MVEQFHWEIKKAQTITNSSENILKSSKRKPYLIETDDRWDFLTKLSTNLLNNNNIEKQSRDTFLGAVFAERFNKNIRDLRERPVFEKRDANCVDLLPTITKQYIDRKHFSIKLAPIEASLEKEWRIFLPKLFKQKKKTKTKVETSRSRWSSRFIKKIIWCRDITKHYWKRQN